MKKIGEVITSVALVAFIVSLCCIESLTVISIVTMLISGAWLVGYGFVYEEEKRLREGR